MPISVGQPGSGKSKVDELFGERIVGVNNYVSLDNITNVVGEFNDVAMFKLFIVCNEMNISEKHDIERLKNSHVGSL
jgi:hypothetical protein